MDDSTYWLAIDKTHRASVHQYEPYYNHLYDKWQSTNMIYVSRSMINIIPDNIITDKASLKAYACEVIISNIDSTRVVAVNKIYKDK